jgi:hypothetical protein
MKYKYSLSKAVVVLHIGHEIVFTEEVAVRCATCNEDIWKHEDVLARALENQKRHYAKMKAEDPDRYRKINREKGRARRARKKADPVQYAEYLAKAKVYNDTARAKRKAAANED